MVNNTKLLISVKNIQEIEKIKDFADIVDLKNPKDGALGAWKEEQIKKALFKYSTFTVLSATIGNLYQTDLIKKQILRLDTLGLDYIKVGFFKESVDNFRDFLEIFKDNFKTKLVLVLFAENKKIISYVRSNLNTISNIGFYYLLIDTFNKQNKGIFDLINYAYLKDLVSLLNQNNLKIGLAGKVNRSQFSKILGIRPNLFGVRSAVCEGFDRNLRISLKHTKYLNNYFKKDTKKAQENAGACIDA